MMMERTSPHPKGTAVVHVSRPVPEPAMDALRSWATVTVGPDRVSTPGELSALSGDADALLAMLTDRIDDAFLGSCPRLRIVANCAVGYDNLDVKAAEARGIWATNTPNVLTETTADLSFALLLAAARRIGEAERHLRGGRFAGWEPLMFLGAPVHGKTLGIVGMGRIGQAVARRGTGFSMRVIYASPRPADLHGAQRVTLEELLSSADFVSIHVPLSDSTRHLIDASALAKMKETYGKDMNYAEEG